MITSHTILEERRCYSLVNLLRAAQSLGQHSLAVPSLVLQTDTNQLGTHWMEKHFDFYIRACNMENHTEYHIISSLSKNHMFLSNKDNYLNNFRTNSLLDLVYTFSPLTDSCLYSDINVHCTFFAF